MTGLPSASVVGVCGAGEVVGLAGEGEEDVIEVRGVDGQPLDLDGGAVELVEQGAQGRHVAVARHLQGQGLLVAGRGGEQPAGGLELALPGEAQLDVPAGDAALELVGGALGHDPAVVKQRDPVGELVGLLQLLGGEEDGDAAGGEVADDLPHGLPAARVKPGRRLVQEDQPRVADQGHGQVEPSPHAARVGAGQLAGRVGEVELAEQLGRPAPSRRTAEMMQVGHQQQVLGAGEQVVDGGELASDADRGANRVGCGGRGHGRPPGARRRRR